MVYSLRSNETSRKGSPRKALEQQIGRARGIEHLGDKALPVTL